METKVIPTRDLPVPLSLISDEIHEFIRNVVEVADIRFGTVVSRVRTVYWGYPGADMGRFHPLTKEVTLNLGRLRTRRDIVVTIGHEYAHALQVHSFPGVNKEQEMYSRYNQEVEKYGYEKAPLEVEADEISFRFEDELDYKNVVLNPAAPSIFVVKKQLRAGLL